MERTHEMALQSATEKMKRLNWRERWQGWRRRLQQTGSETPDKPVSCITGSNSEPVSCETGSEPKPVLTEPERVELLRLWLQAASPRHHAQCLLEWLQAKGHGGQFRASASIRDKAYPELCGEHGWTPQPWHGPGGVGSHFRELCGDKRPIKPDPDAGGKPTRCYKIPAAVVELGASGPDERVAQR